MLESTFREEYLKAVRELVVEIKAIRTIIEEKAKPKKVKKCREAVTP